MNVIAIIIASRMTFEVFRRVIILFFLLAIKI